MYTIQPKKLMIINILDILKKYTDEDHRLSQKDIVDILKKEYSMPADRKAVKSPRYVRFKWTNYAVVGLFGTNGIPVAPFRTDDFPMEDRK